MELFRAGEAVLPFLAPSMHLTRLQPRAITALTAQSRQCRLPHPRPSAMRPQCARSITTTSIARSQWPATQADQRGSEQSSSVDAVASLLDPAQNSGKDASTNPAPRPFSFESYNARNSKKFETDNKASSGNSIDELLKIMNFDAPPRNSKASTAGSRADAVNRSLRPNAASSMPQVFSPLELKAPALKMGPTVGRTVLVSSDKNIDAARAFRLLDIKCARNRVKRDFMAQRFHERPGLKRKRLKSERWRRRFKVQFNATVKMVQKMKKQGW